MNFKSYKKAVIGFGKSIGWNFRFEIDKRHDNIKLMSGLKPPCDICRIFTREYIILNTDWTAELKFLKMLIIKGK